MGNGDKLETKVERFVLKSGKLKSSADTSREKDIAPRKDPKRMNE